MNEFRELARECGLASEVRIDEVTMFVDGEDICTLTIEPYLFEQLRELIIDQKEQEFVDFDGNVTTFVSNGAEVWISGGSKKTLSRYEFLLLCRDMMEDMHGTENAFLNSSKASFKIFVDATLFAGYFLEKENM